MADAKELMTRLKTPLLLLVAAGSLLHAWRVEQRRPAAGGAPAVTGETSRKDGNGEGVVAEGRLVAYPGAEVTVGSDIGGVVESLTVAEQERVKKGQLVASIRADDLRAELERNRANLREVEADIRLHEQEMGRAERLLRSDVWPRQQYDLVRRNLDASRARRAGAEAEIRRIGALIAKTRILAPIGGTVTVRHLEPGETVQPGTRIVTLADLSRTRVEAELDEFDVGRVRLGDRATVSAEGFGQRWQGRVEEVPASVSQRRIKPQDPAKPSDARVLLVKIALEEPTPLKLGQRLEVRIQGRGSKGRD